MTTRRHDEMIERLLADATPVARLWPPWARLVAWLGASGTVVVTAGVVNPRAGLGTLLGDPSFLGEIVLFLVAAAMLALLALRAAEPGRAPGPGALVAVGMLALATAAMPLLAAGSPAVSVGEFLAVGLLCLGETVVLGAGPALLLLRAIRRGAPLAPARAGALAVAGSFLVGYVALRLVCPLDDAPHLFAWHSAPVALAAAVGAALGSIWLGRWRSPRRI